MATPVHHEPPAASQLTDGALAAAGPKGLHQASVLLVCARALAAVGAVATGCLGGESHHATLAPNDALAEARADRVREARRTHIPSRGNAVGRRS